MSELDDLFEKLTINNECKLNDKSNIHIMKPNDVIKGHLITKLKRQELFGKIAGGSGSTKIEAYQRKKIIQGTNTPCIKTNTRINLETHILQDIRNPYSKENGFDYSEDFDGYQIFNNITVYINMKCVVGTGGAQTRTMRDVYIFIKGQLDVILMSNNIDLYFANILDGDVIASKMKLYEHLFKKDRYKDLRPRIYIGDLYGYFGWINSIIN